MFVQVTHDGHCASFADGQYRMGVQLRGKQIVAVYACDRLAPLLADGTVGQIKRLSLSDAYRLVGSLVNCRPAGVSADVLRTRIAELNAIGWDKVICFDGESGQARLRLPDGFELDADGCIRPHILGAPERASYRHAVDFVSAMSQFIAMHRWIDANLTVVGDSSSYSGVRTVFLGGRRQTINVREAQSEWDGSKFGQFAVEDGDSFECGICYTVVLDGRETPDVECECSRRYHRSCLLQWFQTDPTATAVFGTVEGSCLFCQQRIKQAA